MTCGIPDLLEHGEIGGEDYGFDAVVRYKCEVGYELVGIESRMCLANGSWSYSPPTCTSKET